MSLNSFQQKAVFCVFGAVYPGFAWVWATPERLSSLPECLKPWLTYIHAGFPHYAGFYCELNYFFSYIKGNFQVFPLQWNQFCLFLLHCHKVIYIWNTLTPAPLRHGFFLTDLHSGFTTCYWGFFFLFVESPQVLVLSLYFSSKSVIEAMGEGFYTKSMYGHA